MTNTTTPKREQPTEVVQALTDRYAQDFVHEQSSYRMILENLPDHAVFILDPQGIVVTWNQTAERIKGYNAGEIIGHSFSRFFPARDIEQGRPERVLRLTAATGRHEEQGMRVRRDGSQFLAHVSYTTLRDLAGNLRGFCEVSRDLSERQESADRYRGLLEAAPDAMVVVNQAGEIVLLNVQAEKQFGYRRDELLGQKVTAIIPTGFAERLIADGTRSSVEALAQQIGTGIELLARRKDGSDFPIEIMLSPLESRDGILVTAAIRDISVRRDAEKYLSQVEGRYRELLEAAPDAMVTLGKDLRILLVNTQAERLYGYGRDELLGQSVATLCPAHARVDSLGRITGYFRDRIGPIGLETPQLRKDGSEFPAEMNLSTIESGGEILLTATVRDITLRKKAEAHVLAEALLVEKVEELHRSNEELGQFAYIASHDLQEPLRMVASYTQLLSKRYKGRLDADADEFIAFAVDGANRMQRLIQDLLTYSRVGTKPEKLRDTSSEEALEQALQNLGGAIADSGAIVTHDLLPAVISDEGQLIQLFQNLVGNGIKYQTGGIPRVHISASNGGGKKWLFSVKDNGLGIDPQYFDKIFGMFQRLHKREEFAGTGIGLAICKKIVERHGGRLSVESKPGHGATFFFGLTGTELPA